MGKETKLRRLLLLQGPNLEAEETLSILRRLFDVQIVDDPEQAHGAIRRGEVDVILAETSDFLPLERSVVRQRALGILDTIGDGVCIASADGRMIWANRRMKQFRKEVAEPVRRICAHACREFASEGPGRYGRGKRFSFTLPDGTYYEVICSMLSEQPAAADQVAAVVIDATSARRQQMRLDAIDKAGRELVKLEYDELSKRDASARVEWLKQRILSVSRDLLDYRHFAVLLLDKQTNRLEPLLAEGIETGSEHYGLLASTEGNGICGYVAATGRSYICHDVTNDPHYLPGLPGARSSLTVPLCLHDEVIGVLNIESDRHDAFREEDRQFAEIFANYVALALHTLNLLVFERRDVHVQLTDSMCKDFLGPINDIITMGTELAEDYIGHDDLRRRLGELVDMASRVRTSIRQLMAGMGADVSRGAGRSAEDPVLSGKRVLVADDEELIRNTICDILTPCGCQVDVAADGAAARYMLQQEQYDLVISDIKMPGANGYEVFAAAKAACKDTQVILITAFGYDPHHSIVRANREGLSAVLMKPFKVQQLLDQCRKAIQESRQ